jgi:predicted RNA methylase
MQNIFKDINFNEKAVLDIGGGIGIFSFYASLKGASKIVCLEPEARGSASGMVRSVSMRMRHISQ